MSDPKDFSLQTRLALRLLDAADKMKAALKSKPEDRRTVYSIDFDLVNKWFAIYDAYGNLVEFDGSSKVLTEEWELSEWVSQAISAHQAFLREQLNNG